jgi:carbon storage regulator
MLVLTRRAGESIVIGDEVRVVVLDVRGDTVRLGIEAPRSIQVHRAEVYAEVQAANAAAARSDDLGAVAARLQRIARRPGSTPAAVPAPPAPAPSAPTPPAAAPAPRTGVPAPPAPAPAPPASVAPEPPSPAP